MMNVLAGRLRSQTMQKPGLSALPARNHVILAMRPELWTLAALHRHIQQHAEEAGYPRLKTVTKPWSQKYLKSMDIKPF